MQGLDTYKTREGFTVAQVHYSADPQKTTPEAMEMLLEGYPGGKTGAAWRKEMEIDFTAYSGQLLCYDILTNHRNEIIRNYSIEPWHYKFGSLDWGRNNPASFHVYVVSGEGKNNHVHSASEIYLRNTSIPDFCSLIKQAPFYSEMLWISADPSLWSKNQETKDGLRSLFDMFTDEGVHLRKGASKSDQFAINDLLDRWDNLDEKKPRLTISPACHKQVWEWERLRYQEITTAMVEKKNPSEVLVDKDNHSWDDWKYFISTFWSGPVKEIDDTPPRLSVAAQLAIEEERARDWRAKYARR